MSLIPWGGLWSAFERTARFALVSSLGVALLARPALAATSGANGSHDPSRMLESEGKVYIYSTGGGGKSSPDGLVWTGVSGSLPWNRSLPNNQGIWAPDGLYLNGQYFLFGSMWSENDKSSQIVLLTSPTLNPSSPSYRWTDRGVVVAGPSGVTHSVIDPAPVLDNDGNFWVVWGGGYPFANEANSIFLTPLDKQTGLPLTSDPGYQPPNSPGYPLKQGHKEGPYIHFHAGYYYLFWQTGGCCSGASSTYTIHVDRAQSIKGPFSGDRTFYASRGSIHGPGHIGIYSACGFERFTYHYYPDTGGSVIGENELVWGADGWPTVGAESTTPLRLCGSTGGGGMGGAGGMTGASGMAGLGGMPGGGAGAGAGGSGGSGGMLGGSGGSAGDGGAGTSGGSSGGALGNGGAGAMGGASGSGADSTGGTSTAGSSGAGAAPMGGGANGGASSGAGGAQSPSPEPPGAAESGCACDVRGRHDGRTARGFALLALAIVLRARRRVSASLRRRESV